MTTYQVSSQWHIIDNRLAWLMDNDTNQEHRSTLLAGVRKDLKELWERYEEPVVAHVTAVDPEKSGYVTITKTDKQNAGFTGNFCDDCGGSSLIRTGTCETCMDCGSTSGCS